MDLKQNNISENSKKSYIRSISENVPLPEEKDGYIEQRLKGQMDYYHKKCIRLQKEYYCLSILNIIVAAIIPIFILAMESWSFCKYIIPFFSAVSTISTSILLVRKTEENQLNYRKVYEALKTEQIFYLNRVEKYINKESHERGVLFIQKCEELMTNEHHIWFNIKQDTE